MIETFVYQVRKLDKVGLCDFSLAYVCYSACLELVDFCMLSLLEGRRLMARAFKETVDKYKSEYSLLEEFVRLHYKSSILAVSSYKIGTSPSPLLLQYSDFISVRQLFEYLRHGKVSVLLIDIRSKADFDKIHIRHQNLVYVDPSVLKLLQEKHENPTSEDLEEALKASVSVQKFKKFQERHKYDLVVMYDEYYRQPVINDKYKSLEVRVDKSDALQASPFALLIKIVTERNKYLSSRLKQYPLILDGGLNVWLQQIQNQGLARLPPSTSAVEESVSPGLQRAEIKYVTNINDYIGNGTPGSTVSKLASNGDYFQPQSYRIDQKAPSSEQGYNRLKSPALVLTLGVGLPGSYNPTVTSIITPSISPAFPTQNSLSNTTATHTNTDVPARPSVSNGSIFMSQTSSGNGALNSRVSSYTSRRDTDSTLDRLTTGLVNLGNSCYMNCVLQCLVATPSLTKFFFTTTPDGKAVQLSSYKQHINKENRLGTKGAVTVSLVRLFENMLQNQGRCFSPTEFKKIVGSYSPGRQFATFEQQDCIEFLNFILDSLHEDLNKASARSPKERAEVMAVSPENEKMREQTPVRLASTIEWERYLKIDLSTIVDYFQGQFLSRLKCLECYQSSTTYNVFSILSLPIPERMGGNKRVSLFDCLNFFTETELLDGDNKWHCPNCKRFTRLTKTIMITRLPAVLIIHFKRFKMIGNSGRILKLDTFIEYPVENVLDMTLYWPQVGTFLDPENTNGMSAEDERQKLANLPVRNQVAPFRYKLYGVVNHFGNLTTGHYTSYVNKKGWIYFDDSKFTPNCSPEKVLNANAYCLFYRRI